jgi:hypothetical protein
MTTQFRLAVALCASTLLASSATSWADDKDKDDFDRTPRDCVATTAIDRTQILDDQTILFHMRGKRVFRNYLPKKCPGLKREGRFMYQTTHAQLCDVDMVTVLEEWGGRFTPGFTCKLGDFQPITREEAEELTAVRGKDVRNAIDSKPVELPAGEGQQENQPAASAEDEAQQPAAEPARPLTRRERRKASQQP